MPVHCVHVRFRKISATDSRLVCNDEKLVTGSLKSGQGLWHTRQDHNLIRAAQILLFFDQGPVAIHKYRSMHGAGLIGKSAANRKPETASALNLVAAHST